MIAEGGRGPLSSLAVARYLRGQSEPRRIPSFLSQRCESGQSASCSNSITSPLGPSKKQRRIEISPAPLVESSVASLGSMVILAPKARAPSQTESIREVRRQK